MVEQVAATAYHLHQTQTGVQVFFVGVKVLNQRVDAVGPDCNLNFRRTRITRFGTVLCNNFLFFSFVIDICFPYYIVFKD